jgi:hypothetical protein
MEQAVAQRRQWLLIFLIFWSPLNRTPSGKANFVKFDEVYQI